MARQGGISLLCAAVAFWVGYAVGGQKRRRARKAPKQAFVLAVSLTFQEVSHRDEFVKVWTPLAEYVQAEEHGTLSFELAVSDGDPCKVIVYERYTSRGEFLEVHRKSAAFLLFKQLQSQLPFGVEVSGTSYIESGLGFMSR